MRIAFICTEKLPVPAIRGGAIQVLIDGVAPFISEKHRLTVFSIKDPDLPKRETRDGINYIRFLKNQYTNSVTQYLKNHEPFDVVHVFNRPCNVYKFKQASPSSGFVLSLHNEMFSPQKITDEQLVQCVNSADKIITVSDYIGKTAVRRYPDAANKVKTVYSGADLAKFAPNWSVKDKRDLLRKKFGLKGKKAILFVGRLHPQKGPHVLIEAFNMIADNHPRAVLVIVGGRRFNDNSVDRYILKLRRLAEPVRERVIFTGHLPPAEITDYYTASDIFVCSSQWQEPLARVQYEAMAAGLPVITTNRGGNTEVITHGYNGLVINDYKNPAAFARVLDIVLSKPRMAEDMARKGRRQVEEYYNFQRVADDLMQIYEAVLVR